MFDKFRDYMYYLLFTPLKKVIKKDNQFYIFFKVAGKIFDDIKEDIFKVREESMIFTASEELLQEHGKDRGIIRLDGETVENFRKRLIMKAIISELAGTNEGVILAVKSLGFDKVEIIPCYIFDSDRWAEFYIKLNLDIDNELPISFNILRNVVRDVKQASALPRYNFTYTCHQVKINEKFVNKVINRFTINWFNPIGLLNGSFLLNGERYLDKEIVNYKVKSINKAKMVTKEKITATTVTITHNLWHLDGSMLLDGSKTLDAYQIKEEL